MERKRFNANVTADAFEIIRLEADKYGTSMGAIVSMWAIEKRNASTVLDGMALIKEEYKKSGQAALNESKR